jgi:hypothetical protein
MGENWRVFRYAGTREISHADYWRQNVAVIVAKYSGVPFGALRELPYCLPRGRYVASCGLPSHAGQAVLFCGEKLDAAQREALHASYGELPVSHDEHEVRLNEDVIAFERLLSKAGAQFSPSTLPSVLPLSRSFSSTSFPN